MMMMEVVPLLNPTEGNLKRTLHSLPIRFVQGLLLHIQSCTDFPRGVEGEWYVDRLLHEIEDVGVELFIQKLDADTLQESCSLLNLGANQDEVSQLQISLETYAKDKRIHDFLDSMATEILERYCIDLKIHHKSAAPKNEIEDTLTAEILLLGLEGLLNLLTVPLLRQYYTALHIAATAPVVLKQTQLVEEIVLHSFNPRYQGIQPTARIKAEPIETHENESSGDSDRDGDADGADGGGDGDGTRHLRLPSTPKTPYSTPRSRLSATDIQRTTPRKDLDKMLVKDLRQYLQTQGLKYDDKRSVLINRVLRHHRSDAEPATPIDENATNNSTNNNNNINNNNNDNKSNNHKPSSASSVSGSGSGSVSSVLSSGDGGDDEDETDENHKRGEPSSRRKLKRSAEPEPEPASYTSGSSSARKKVRSNSS